MDDVKLVFLFILSSVQVLQLHASPQESDLLKVTVKQEGHTLKYKVCMVCQWSEPNFPAVHVQWYKGNSAVFNHYKGLRDEKKGVFKDRDDIDGKAMPGSHRLNIGVVRRTDEDSYKCEVAGVRDKPKKAGVGNLILQATTTTKTTTISTTTSDGGKYSFNKKLILALLIVAYTL